MKNKKLSKTKTSIFDSDKKVKEDSKSEIDNDRLFQKFDSMGILQTTKKDDSISMSEPGKYTKEREKVNKKDELDLGSDSEEELKSADYNFDFFDDLQKVKKDKPKLPSMKKNKDNKEIVKAKNKIKKFF